MQSRLAHLQVNVNRDNLPFYQDLTSFLGWDTIYGDDGMLGVSGANGASIWFVDQVNDITNDHDGTGMNHLAFGVDSQDDVDAAAAWLTEHGIEHLFATPRHRPEFSSDEASTYYQVMFESPDRLLFEIVYTGPKSS
jgi:catechol 2,3-dioxygenase-like lactoylglutathione lyase family enzyme